MVQQRGKEGGRENEADVGSRGNTWLRTIVLEKQSEGCLHRYNHAGVLRHSHMKWGDDTNMYTTIVSSPLAPDYLCQRYGNRSA